MNIGQIIDHILAVEGSAYTNHPADRGGPTKWGITQHTLSGFYGRPASIAEVQSITEDAAREIYLRRYVIGPGFDRVAQVDPALGAELVDAGVNVGPGRAAEWLQRALNVLNRGATDYADLKVDGDIGPATLTALRSFISRRGADGRKVLLRTVDGLQRAHYLTLAERSPSQEAFFYGWMLHRTGDAA